MKRRDFLRAGAAAAAALPDCLTAAGRRLEFEISLVESSLARSVSDHSLTQLDLSRVAKQQLQVSAIEYVSEFFDGRQRDDNYLDELNRQAAEHGVRQLLIRVHGEGLIGDPDAGRRKQALDNHRQWIAAARSIGCHSVQVNPASSGNEDQQRRRAIDGVAELCDCAISQKINILLGNYGGLSANAAWVISVLAGLNGDCCGTLPQIGPIQADPDYKQLASLAAVAKGITAYASDFDSRGHERHVDYFRALHTVFQAGYRGYVGIHFAGRQMDEMSGIRATKNLLEQVRSGGV